MFKVIVQQIPFIYGVPHASKKDYKKDACIRPALFRTSNVFIPFSMSTLRDPAKKVLALAARPLRPYSPPPPSSLVWKKKLKEPYFLTNIASNLSESNDFANILSY